MLALVALLAAAQPPLTYEQQVAAAVRDYKSLSPEEQYYTRYLSLHSIPADIKASEVMRFILPHLSQQQVLERIMPAQIPDTQFYRIALDDLHWTLDAWNHVMEDYPYSSLGKHSSPLLVRWDWLAFQTSDAQLSTSYYDLLYAEKRFPDKAKAKATPRGVGKAFPHTGGPRRGSERPRPTRTASATPYAAPAASNFPKDADEFFDFHGVDIQKNKPFQRGVVIDEGKSGVALHTRLAAFYPYEHGVASQTFDSETGVGESDALNKLDGGLKFDATEIIVAMPKVSITKDKTFAVQAYLLTDGQQKTVNEASTRIVLDSTDRLPNIRTPGSCIRCHSSGILSLPENAVRAFVADGGIISKYKKEDAEAFERFYLLSLSEPVKGYQAQFTTFVEAVCDLPPAQVSGEYGKLLAWYERAVTLEQAAIEVYAKDARELELAIGLYAARRPTISIRLARLTQKGKTIPRGVWEDSVFQQAAAALSEWRAR